MNLQRVTYFNGTIIDTEREPKTKQKFFTQLLDLRSGANFTLNINKWKAIQESGLFYNLTARVHESPDGIVMDIKGKELPSITFAPEVSLSPSLDRPEISGGVSC